MKTRQILILLIMLPPLLLAWPACNPEIPENQLFEKSAGVFIVNEGNFTYGNASLSFLDLETNHLDNQVFFRANGFPLGDVAHSMTLTDSVGYVCVNNSGKIFAIDLSSFAHLGTIAGLTSPRFFLLLGPEKAYVSDLYATHLTIVNPAKLSITGTVETGCSTEQMLLWSDHVLVLNWSFGNQLLKIDAASDQVVGSLQLPLQPNSMVSDHQGRLWVLSDGGFAGSAAGNQPAALTVVDPASMVVLSQLDFPNLNQSPRQLRTNYAGDTLYFLSGGWDGGTHPEAGVHRMPVSSQTLPDEAWIPQQHRHFYALGIEPGTSAVYVSDAQDYLQNGWIYRFNAQGSLTDSLEADRIPGFFAFKKQ